ncbi:class I SAM-dependent methyltransferase [Marinobacterium sp. YM272]|uniref:class I SAM-dependent methyltransferase n=1 Tax=Marinobacterium sp. YM272 TaxID=3421654 RepID=UPI003D7F886C
MTIQAEHITDTRGCQAIDVLKAKQKATWEDGDYVRFASFMEKGAIDIVTDWQLTPGQRLLDVACGTGQSALPASRRGLRVTGVDLAQNLVDFANSRARAEGLDARFDQGDAEALPYKDADYDVVVSMIGAMFAPRPDRVSSEFGRVLRSGGTLYMCNWTPDSMPAQLFKAVAKRVPPPPGSLSPVLWGDENTATERLSEHFTDIRLQRKLYPKWHYPFSTNDLVRLFRTTFGPVKKAFDAIDGDEQQTLFTELNNIYRNFSLPDGKGGITIQGEYLEVIAKRR